MKKECDLHQTHLFRYLQLDVSKPNLDQKKTSDKSRWPSHSSCIKIFILKSCFPKYLIDKLWVSVTAGCVHVQFLLLFSLSSRFSNTKTIKVPLPNRSHLANTAAAKALIGYDVNLSIIWCNWGETFLSTVRFWATEGSTHPESVVPAESISLPDPDISIGDSRLLLSKNKNCLCIVWRI